jgi:GTP-binding protein LepA
VGAPEGVGMNLDRVRNFCIVAHIDHGKSTLADRILLKTGAVEQRQFQDQFLDSHVLERERGITIKAKAVALKYRDYRLNLIDTPGHADFSYEVSKSLAACEGALLVVDASQGIQAQTVANLNLAVDAGLEIIPVVNKIDLQHAQVDATVEEIVGILGCSRDEVLKISAKQGIGIDELMEAILARIPAPRGDPAGRLQALTFDSSYDEYRGVVVYVRIRNGRVRKTDTIQFAATGGVFQVEEVGVFMPAMKPVEELQAGDVGYIMANVKSIRDVRIGDTVRLASAPDTPPLPGYKEPVPMVFCEFFPAGETDIDALQKAIDRLSLNDAAFTFQRVSSDALGPGFHCGFLGLLHMEIIQERLERESGIEVLKTAPQTTYQIVLPAKGGGTEVVQIESAARAPDEATIVEWREPIVHLKVVLTPEFIGNVMKLCEAHRGEFIEQKYIGANRVILTYDMPFGEIVYDFYDRLKSVSRGFASMDYAFVDYFPSDLVRLRILVASREVDALSLIVHKDRAEHVGRNMLRVLRKEIPRHAFQVALQAAVGNKFIARENIAPYLKDVISKCYGGDYTRKRKLLERQKEGKKRMKSVGQVEIPQEAFMAVLRVNQE